MTGRLKRVATSLLAQDESRCDGVVEPLHEACGRGLGREHERILVLAAHAGGLWSCSAMLLDHGDRITVGLPRLASDDAADAFDSYLVFDLVLRHSVSYIISVRIVDCNELYMWRNNDWYEKERAI